MKKNRYKDGWKAVEYFKRFIEIVIGKIVFLFYATIGVIIGYGISVDTRTILVTGIPGFGGGPFTFLRFLLNQLSRHYHIVCSFKSDELNPALVNLCKDLNIKIYERPNNNGIRDVVAITRCIKDAHPCVTIVNVGTFANCFHVLSLPIPIIYYSHSIWHRPLPLWESIFLPFFRLYGNHKILTVSSAAKYSIDNEYFPAAQFISPVKWIYNGLEDRAGNIVEYSSSVFTIVTLGSVVWYKNPELWERIARRVVASLPRGAIRFYWAGQGELLSSLALRNDDSVKFLGFQSDPDNLLKSANVYFQPSKFESFGLGVCEAMMFGKPVVASCVGALPELITDGVEGFLVSLEEEELMISLLVKLAQDRELCSRMGLAARKRYLNSFTEKHWLLAFEKFMKENYVR